MGSAEFAEIESREAAFFNKRSPEQLLWILSASDGPGKLCTNREHLIAFLAADFHNACMTKPFVYICSETLRALLLSPHLICDHPEDAIKAVARWVRFDSVNRKRYLDSLVPLLPHDHKHPLRSKAAIVANWDVYHHAHSHKSPVRHQHHHRRSDGSANSTASSGINDVHHNHNHNHHHAPFHFHLHRPHLPQFMHRNASSNSLQSKSGDTTPHNGDETSPKTVVKDSVIIESRTTLGDRMIEKRSSVRGRDVEIHTRT